MKRRTFLDMERGTGPGGSKGQEKIWGERTESSLGDPGREKGRV